MKALQLFTSFLLCIQAALACNGGVASGTLNPTAVFQTVNTQNGRYYAVNVTQCNQYEFTFCTGGAASAMDSQLTLLDNTGVTEIVYADDVCGTNASITWTATFTGTVRILVSRFNCNHDLTSNVTLAYRMTASVGGYCLGGNALNTVISGQNCIQLTAEVNDQTGCAWNSSMINFSNAFNLSLNYYFGNNINGADGTTFTFQPNPGACGTPGGQLGAGGIPNSLVVEFDTYDNDFPAHIFDMSQDHVAVEIDGNLLGPGAPYCGPTPALASGGNLDDGNLHAITINWDPGTQNLQIYVDGSLRLTCNGNFVTSVFGGDNTVYWGATAATGGLNNQQYFCPATVLLPVELTHFYSTCNDFVEQVNWIAENEVNVSHYILEATQNGEIFVPVSTMKALGTQGAPRPYHFQVKENWPVQMYYRLTMVDQDGNIKHTELIAAKTCRPVTESLMKTYAVQDGQVIVHLNQENCAYRLWDVSGKLISEKQDISGNEAHLQAPAEGMYILHLSDKNGSEETHRIYIH